MTRILKILVASFMFTPCASFADFPTCLQALGLEETTVGQSNLDPVAVDVIRRLSDALELVEDSNTEYPEVTNERARDLFSRQGSASHMKNMIKMQNGGLVFNSWLTIEEKIFVSPELESQEIVSVVEALFNRFQHALETSNRALEKSILNGMKPPGVLQHRRKAVQLLDKLSLIMSTVFETSFDLTKPADLYRLFGVSGKSEIKNRIHGMHEANAALNRRIGDLLDSNLQYEGIADDMQDYFYPDTNVKIMPQNLATFFDRTISYSVIRSHIMNLPLSESDLLEALFKLEQVKGELLEQPKLSEVRYVKFIFLLLFYYYLEQTDLGDEFREAIHSAPHNQSNYFSIVASLNARARQATFNEEFYDRWIERAELAEQRMNQIEERASVFMGRGPRITSDLNLVLDRLTDIDVAVFESPDEQGRLDRIIDQIEFDLDRAINSFLERQSARDIDRFIELNFNWKYLLPDKTYRLQGQDYDAVTFSSDVVKYFKHNHNLGSRYLTALYKGYVSREGSSGLRSIPTIHRGFRDIKVLHNQGKVRIVGKLVGRTIHFFLIHDKNESYGSHYSRLLGQYESSVR